MSEVDTLSGDNSTVYTPTTEEIRADYCLLADVSRPRQLQFDRWLAEVKAEACTHTFAQQLEEHSLAELIRIAKAKAWDDCAQEAYDRGMLHDINFEDIKALNPYRQGEEQ